MAQAYALGQTGQAIDQASIRVTEMENLGEAFGTNRQRLRECLIEIEDSLDLFDPTSRAASAESAPQVQEAPPGTLLSLRRLAETTNADLDRLEAIRNRLRNLL